MKPGADGSSSWKVSAGTGRDNYILHPSSGREMGLSVLKYLVFPHKMNMTPTHYFKQVESISTKLQPEQQHSPLSYFS